MFVEPLVPVLVGLKDEPELKIDGLLTVRYDGLYLLRKLLEPKDENRLCSA